MEQMWNTEYLLAMSRSSSLLITIKANCRMKNDVTMTLQIAQNDDSVKK